MLERQRFESSRSDEDSGQWFSLGHFFSILKRRALYFVIPFVLVLAIGSFVTLAWPAIYLSQGKILISSQEIPTELVRPTVGKLASDRIQTIEQRILTRDNLLSLAKKFQLTSGWQGQILGTEIVDFIKDRIKIRPLELSLQGDRKGAVAFTVGFEYEQPQIATKVANELVTMILNEDVRSRTSFAAETTNFLEQEVNRLENDVSQTDAQIIDLRERKIADPNVDSASDDAKALAALRAELLLKSATYSDNHPDILALKRKIEAFKKTNPPAEGKQEASKKVSTEASGKAVPPKPASSGTVGDAIGLDGLEGKRQSLKSELVAARQRLTAARLGENLERGQHSERLEVIEQATVPQKPTSPNRPKIFGVSFVVALMAGVGFIFVSETTNPAIRRSVDLYSVFDSHLIVSIPYISTLNEVRRRRNRIILTVVVLFALVVGGAAAALYILPPPDILLAKAMKVLFR